MTVNTDYIEIEDGQRVSEPEFIEEFYANTDANTVKAVQETLTKFNEQGALPSHTVECTECHVPYKVPVVFDYAAFFGNGS